MKAECPKCGLGFRVKKKKREVSCKSQSAGSAEDATPLTDRARRTGDSITLVAMCRELEWENAELRKGLHAAKQLLDAFKAAAELDMPNVKNQVEPINREGKA